MQKIAEISGVLMAAHEEILAEGLRHHQAGRLQEAERRYRQVLAASPANPDALHLLGLVAHQVGQSEAAVALIRQAIEYAGEIPAYYNNLGEAYRTLGQFADAIECYRRAIAIDDEFAEAYNNLGTIYQNQGALDEALALYEKAIACQGDYVNAHYNRARVWLARGDFVRGWKEYEWRWRRPEFGRLQIFKPEWDGSPLAGRTLLVRWEQGLGDTLQFVRYVKVLERAGESIVAQVQGELVALLAQSGFANVVAADQPLPPFDVQAMLMSLPYLVGTTLETIPSEIPYLSVPPAEAEKWKAELGAAGGLTVGIAWQGSPRNPHDRWRSIPLAQFARLANASGARLFSLQVGAGREQLADLPARGAIPDLAERIAEVRDTAAIMTALDLVITTDTLTAHLAGALGVEVWVALSAAADFRWLQERSDSPWYPTMRLFRQRRLGEWSDVFDEIAAALAGHAKAKR